MDSNDKLLGQVVNVIIDSSYDNMSIGRFYGQAPEIDSVVYIDQTLQVGSIYNVKIYEKLEYDFKGEVL
jgi:tRNA A37 methylthiotransferase MiaB